MNNLALLHGLSDQRTLTSESSSNITNAATASYLIPFPSHQLHHNHCPFRLQRRDCASAYSGRYACVVLLISTTRISFLYMYVMPLVNESHPPDLC